MKLFFGVAVLLLLLFPALSRGQEVPSSALGAITSKYTAKGMKLEQTIMPGNSKALYKCSVCFPGKKVTVLAVLAKEPKDWFFKLRYNNSIVNKKNKPETMLINGATYWLNYMTAYTPTPSFKNNSDKCMTILAYDKADVRLPVYFLVFTEAK